MKRESWGGFRPVLEMAVIVFAACFLVFPKVAGAADPGVWRTVYRDNWEYRCPVLGNHIIDPEETCSLVASPARLGPIVIRDASVILDAPFTEKHDPKVKLVRYDVRHPVMSRPEYVGPRFFAEKMLCADHPGKWITTYRPVVDTKGKLIRYDPEQVRIFCRK